MATGARHLLQVHSIVVFIEKIDGASNEIYGEIKAEDCALCIYDIYNVEKKDAKSISADGILPLTGPSQCIVNPPNFAIGVCLKEKGLDLEVSNGYFTLSRCCSGGWYDRPVRVVIKGEHGYVVLHLSLLKLAVQATVEVVLVHTNRYIQKPRFAIHGDIVAKYSGYRYKSNYAKKYYPTVMLSVPKDEPIELEHVAQDDQPGATKVAQYDESSPAKMARYDIDEPSPRKVKLSTEKFKIPLSRCTIAVPCYSELIIEANLCNNVEIDLRENSAQVVSVSGIATFYAGHDEDGTTFKVIEGRNCHIEMKVSWLAEVQSKAYRDAIASRSEGRQQIY